MHAVFFVQIIASCHWGMVYFLQVPSKPSQYITAAVKPLSLFIEEHTDVLGEQQKVDICAQVFSNLAEQ